jgi:adenylosuccinate synthase
MEANVLSIGTEFGLVFTYVTSESSRTITVFITSGHHTGGIDHVTNIGKATQNTMRFGTLHAFATIFALQIAFEMGHRLGQIEREFTVLTFEANRAGTVEETVICGKTRKRENMKAFNMCMSKHQKIVSKQ